MINMITDRRCIATLFSCLLLTVVYAYRPPATTSTTIKQPASEVATVDIPRPVPDLEEVEEIASESLTNRLVSVIESPPSETFTSQPIQSTNALQTAQVRRQQDPSPSPTIESPVPPNYQDIDPPGGIEPPAPVDPTQEDENLDVLMRGPLHEAYAEVYQYDPKPSVVIDRKPPDPIDELPPEFKPDGENVVWIPGYWAWDDERKDFIWISGVWRNTPAGQRWVAGYWQSECQ